MFVAVVSASDPRYVEMYSLLWMEKLFDMGHELSKDCSGVFINCWWFLRRQMLIAREVFVQICIGEGILSPEGISG